MFYSKLSSAIEYHFQKVFYTLQVCIVVEDKEGLIVNAKFIFPTKKLF